MKDIKLSIIAPCYNGAKYIGDFFENLFTQTYKDYELIVVNDGSKDDSDRVIKSYENKFRDNGIVFKYIHKEKNEGHSKALNDGLKYVDGKFLMWPDIDDYMHDNHLQSRVEFMEKHPNISIAFGRVAVKNDDNLNKTLYYAWNKFPKIKNELINSFMNGSSRNVGYMSGNFIVKTESLWNIYPDKEIYSEIKVGPTIQMVFPIMYLYEVGYIRECTFDYYIHGNNQHLVYEKQQYGMVELVYQNVINNMKIDKIEKENLLNIANRVTNHLLLSYAFKNLIVSLEMMHIVN